MAWKKRLGYYFTHFSTLMGNSILQVEVNLVQVLYTWINSENILERWVEKNIFCFHLSFTPLTYVMNSFFTSRKQTFSAFQICKPHRCRPRQKFLTARGTSETLFSKNYINYPLRLRNLFFWSQIWIPCPQNYRKRVFVC